MKTLKLIVLFLIPFSCLVTNAAEDEPQKEKEHTIDIWLGKQLETHYSTAGMLNALYEGQEMWDKELNLVYARLMKQLPKTKQTILKNSQRAWITFRDANSKLINATIADQQGSMYRVEAADAHYRAVKSRVLQLLEYERSLP